MRSYGDCANKVGKHPSNVQWCNDKNWFSCWLEGFENFFMGGIDGILKIFLPGRGEGVDDSDRVSQKNRKNKKAGRNRHHTLPRIDPETLRLSAAAQSLLMAKTSDGLLSI